MKVGDLVKEKNGPLRGIIVEIYDNSVVEFGAEIGEYISVKVLYSDGTLFEHSSRAYEVISEGR